MTLLDRITARQCRVVDCTRERVEGALVCRDDLRELFRNRLDRNPDGTYSRRRTFPPRDLTWSRAA
jgi:hypothetical protein